MKYSIIIAIVFQLAIKVNAQDQIKQGVYSLSGSISYTSISSLNNSTKSNGSEFSISPNVSYFIIDQVEMIVGVANTYSSGIYASPSYEFKSKTLAAVLGLRYYFPLGLTAPFVGASGQLNWRSANGQRYLNPVSAYSFTGGICIFFSETAALEPAVIYSKMRYSGTSSTDQIRVGIGVNYFIK